MIGFGNMGQAFYKGMLKTLSPEDIFVCDKSIEKMDGLPTGNITTDINQFIDSVDIVILAVKPQVLRETVQKISSDLSDKVIVSMLAGASIESLSQITKSKKIMRIMPNLAVEFGDGVVGMIANFDEDIVSKLKIIFSAMGGFVEVNNENKLNQLAALSGSGLAYFYYFSEIMQRKALTLGFSKEDASLMASQTLIGSGSVMKNRKISPDELRRSVASKGGTTQAALDCMIEEDLKRILDVSIDKAIKKASDLSASIDIS